mgnify:CR=1 FL=1
MKLVKNLLIVLSLSICLKVKTVDNSLYKIAGAEPESNYLYIKKITGGTFKLECPKIITGDMLYTLVAAATNIKKEQIFLFLGDQIVSNDKDTFLPIQNYQAGGGLRLMQISGKKTASPKAPETAPAIAVDPSKVRSIKLFGSGLDSIQPTFNIVIDQTTNQDLFRLASAATGYQVKDLNIKIGGFPIENNDELVSNNVQIAEDTAGHVIVTVLTARGAIRQALPVDESGEVAAASGSGAAVKDLDNVVEVERILFEVGDVFYSYLVSNNFENKKRAVLEL